MGKLKKVTKAWRRLPRKTQRRIKRKARSVFNRGNSKK